MKNFFHIGFWGKILYTAVALGVLAIIVLHIAGIVPTIGYPLVLLILILVVLPIVPNISEITVSKDERLSLKTCVGIKEADAEDIRSNDAEMDQELNCSTSNRSIHLTDLRSSILEAFCEKRQITKNEMKKNRQIEVLDDKIGTYNPVFSWYSNCNNEEVLYEPKFTAVNRAFFNKLYVMLSKIAAYNEQHERNIKLVLLVVKKTSGNELGVSGDEIDVLKRNFEKSENNGIFEIQYIDINQNLKTKGA